MAGANGATAPSPATALPALDQIKTMAATRATMAMVDTDHNGMISKPEMTALNDRLFDMADTNKDGQLSETELQALGANMTRVMALLK